MKSLHLKRLRLIFLFLGPVVICYSEGTTCKSTGCSLSTLNLLTQVSVLVSLLPKFASGCQLSIYNVGPLCEFGKVLSLKHIVEHELCRVFAGKQVPKNIVSLAPLPLFSLPIVKGYDFFSILYFLLCDIWHITLKFLPVVVEYSLCLTDIGLGDLFALEVSIWLALIVGKVSKDRSRGLKCVFMFECILSHYGKTMKLLVHLWWDTWGGDLDSVWSWVSSPAEPSLDQLNPSWSADTWGRDECLLLYASGFMQHYCSNS